MSLPNPVTVVKRAAPSPKVVHNTIQYGALVPAAVAIVTALCASFHWHLNLEQQASIAGLLAMVVAAILNATDAPSAVVTAVTQGAEDAAIVLPASISASASGQ